LFWCGRRGVGGVGSTVCVCGASAGAGRAVLVRWWWCEKRGGGAGSRVQQGKRGSIWCILYVVIFYNYNRLSYFDNRLQL